jgi:hypothetical protein
MKYVLLITAYLHLVDNVLWHVGKIMSQIINESNHKR